jgi:hypothetical protein
MGRRGAEVLLAPDQALPAPVPTRLIVRAST